MDKTKFTRDPHLDSEGFVIAGFTATVTPTTFTFHSDPAHSWLEVDWTALKKLGLNPTDFSRYSYRRHNTFFLEEDCDATKFIEAWRSKHGADSVRFYERHSNGNSFVRSLPAIY